MQKMRPAQEKVSEGVNQNQLYSPLFNPDELLFDRIQTPSFDRRDRPSSLIAAYILSEL